jgi:hypothetical protein
LAEHIKPDEDPIDRLPFDELLKKKFASCDLKGAGAWFHRVTLPRSQAEQLEFDLALEGVTRATLFPDFAGVAGTMRDTDRWMREGGPGHSRLVAHLDSFAVSYKTRVPINLGKHAKADPSKRR